MTDCIQPPFVRTIVILATLGCLTFTGLLLTLLLWAMQKAAKVMGVP